MMPLPPPPPNLSPATWLLFIYIYGAAGQLGLHTKHYKWYPISHNICIQYAFGGLLYILVDSFLNIWFPWCHISIPIVLVCCRWRCYKCAARVTIQMATNEWYFFCYSLVLSNSDNDFIIQTSLRVQIQCAWQYLKRILAWLVVKQYGFLQTVCSCKGYPLTPIHSRELIRRMIICHTHSTNETYDNFLWNTWLLRHHYYTRHSMSSTLTGSLVTQHFQYNQTRGGWNNVWFLSITMYMYHVCLFTLTCGVNYMIA